MSATVVREVDTPHGRARVHSQLVEEPRAALVLGHGAGGGVAARDLLAATEAALAQRVQVTLVEQPYRVAGRRSPAPAAQLDTAWRAVVAALREDEARGLPLVVGGRSSGARVACRTAEALGAAAVLCLAFPLLPPPRRSGGAEPVSRLPELDAVRVSTLVVQGMNDRFGVPPAAPGRSVVVVPGDHALRSGLAELREAVGAWLEEVVEVRAVAEERAL
ncbi:alpha/beta family hydrolase [Gaiella sp.]|uniref:alpha/beta hydrolase family protein n=1 Tax=Gaiella sp. TaxID=2663207 RepID=UPI002E3516F1|nr:alpha/beta family hydrolase [Gaiella sp.]HEX5582730.1 alpha/beta family hydrolase [Gaiella sp.]